MAGRVAAQAGWGKAVKRLRLSVLMVGLMGTVAMRGTAADMGGSLGGA